MDGRSGDDILEGGLGNDTLIGGLGNDYLDGGSGNDLFYTGIGLDNVYGGAGEDTVRYDANLNRFDFNDLANYFQVLNDDRTSTDNLYDVEYIAFQDIVLPQNELLDFISLQESVGRLYNALLGRSGDNAGFLYWLQDVASGSELQDVAGNFAGSEEYLARFGAQSNEEFINQLYNNILSRNADQAGYDYWLAEIAREGNRDGMIVSFSESEEYINAQADIIGTFLDNVDLSTYIA